MNYKFFDKTTSGGAIKNENMSNKELAEELRTPIIRNLRKESTLIFYGQYVRCWSYWHALNKQV